MSYTIFDVRALDIYAISHVHFQRARVSYDVLMDKTREKNNNIKSIVVPERMVVQPNVMQIA